MTQADWLLNVQAALSLMTHLRLMIYDGVKFKAGYLSAGVNVVSKTAGQYVTTNWDAERTVDEQRKSENIRIVKGIEFG